MLRPVYLRVQPQIGAIMELPEIPPDPGGQDHEARIIKLETQVQSLSQQLTLEIAALKVWFSEKLDFKLEDWRKENDRKLEDWRRENNQKLEDWRKENDHKLEEWRREHDHKLEDWRKENDRKLEEWRQGFDRKLDGLRGDMDKKFMWMIGLVVALMVGLYFR